MRSNEQGVSESIGFMLIFTIVIAGIALVTLYGYPLLLQQQVGAEEKIMEKNMIVLQNDMKSLAYKTVPYQRDLPENRRWIADGIQFKSQSVILNYYNL